VHQVTNRLV